MSQKINEFLKAALDLYRKERPCLHPVRLNELTYLEHILFGLNEELLYTHLKGFVERLSMPGYAWIWWSKPSLLKKLLQEVLDAYERHSNFTGLIEENKMLKKNLLDAQVQHSAQIQDMTQRFYQDRYEYEKRCELLEQELSALKMYLQTSLPQYDLR